MVELDKKYQIELDSIKVSIQSSELLEKYLEDEEEADYQALREKFEPLMEDVYIKVAEDHPLQLLSLEQKLLDDGFEGLYLSKVLGYAVLRGEIGDHYKYKRPQDQFKDILLAICNSANFEFIKNRIGQGVQLGFALSSDIWITNLINQLNNQKVKFFLESNRLDKSRVEYERKVMHSRYSKQFQSLNFYSAEFPKNNAEMKVLHSSLHKFLIYRIMNDKKNTSLVPHVKALLSNEEFKHSVEYLRFITLFTMFFEEGENKEWLKKRFNEERKTAENFESQYFEYLLAMLVHKIDVDKEADTRVYDILDKKVEDDLIWYYKTMDEVHSKGYIHDDAIEAVRSFYDSHAGLSTQNECLRWALFSYFEKLMKNLPVEDYTSYFEINKTFSTYMNIFDNEEFNIQLKKLSLIYVKKLMKKFTDKRGRDYQDIKKFVKATFLDHGFMNDKELVELFKTRRKKKVS